MQSQVPSRWTRGGQFGRLSHPLLWSLLGARVKSDDARVPLLRDALMEGDPIADALASWMESHPDQGRARFEEALDHGIGAVRDPPEELSRFFENVDRVPAWLDRRKLRVATKTILRCGEANFMALGGVSLMSGYLSGATVKVLVKTGGLTKMARRRIAETARFVYDVATSREVGRTSDGFKSTVRVRLMHAIVRRKMSASADWRTADWGTPINQSDMLGTSLEFSSVYVFALMGLGFLLSPAECEAVMHLWRYVGGVMGVRDDLLPTSFKEGLQVLHILSRATQGPDEDSRALAAALLQANAEGATGAFEARFFEGYSRFVLGREAADALGLPDTLWKYAPLAMLPPRVALEVLQRVVPGARARATRRGGAAILANLDRELAGRKPEYRPYPSPSS